MKFCFFNRGKVLLRRTVALILYLALTQVIFAQQKDNVKSEFFRELNIAFSKASYEAVTELAPKLYSKALELYREAEPQERRRGCHPLAPCQKNSRYSLKRRL